MGRYIVKMERDNKVRYMEWSTIVDAPVTYLMPLEEFKTYYREEYGRRDSEREFVQRMGRVEAKGISSHVDSYTGLWEYNRAGEGETQLTEEECWIEYHDKRPPPGPEPSPGELWRHYKGTTYKIVMISEHSETGQTMIIYRDPNLEPAKHWARPLSMWDEEIEDGVHRFEPVTE